LPCNEQCVLQDVLGVLQGTEHPIAVHPQFSPVRLGQLSKRFAIAGSGPDDQVGRQHFSLALLSPYRHRRNRELGGEADHFPDIAVSA
jgi:hypothetical protein